MPLLRNKFLSDQIEKEQIDKKLDHTIIKPTPEEEKIIQEIMIAISDRYKSQIAESGITPKLSRDIRDTVHSYCQDKRLEYEMQKRIEWVVVSNITGLGPIQPYMDDDDVTEIVVQRYNNICVERNGLIESVDAEFISESQLRTVINRIVQPIGRQIDLHMPMVDARLSDGSRVNSTIPPVTPDGATLTIRKFSDKALTGEDYLRLGSLNEVMLEFLKECVESKDSIIVSGGTNTGKTTLLNMLSAYIPKRELIITIEDSCELNLHQPNVRRMETRVKQNDNMMPITIQSLVKNSLRMRPDRIIVGEIRDGAIVDMMSAMSTGHEGSLSTVHANSPQNLINSRIPILYGMNSDVTFSEEAQKIQIVEAIQLIVQIEHMADGKRRITYITHVSGLKDGKIELKDIFRYDEKKNEYYATGYIPESILERIRKCGFSDTEKLCQPHTTKVTGYPVI